MTLVGFDASFSAHPNSLSETFIQSSGAIAGGGEGYADFQAGYRIKSRANGLRTFGEIALGFGGGGDVDTGGGLIASVGAGVAIPLFPGFDIEAGTQITTALDGDLLALSPFVRAALTFGNKNKEPYTQKKNWQLFLGTTYQQHHSGFRKPGNPDTASPILAESSLDLFLTDRVYFTGNAQTVMSGDAGGYAVGLVGFGYAMPLNDRWTISGEAHLGAGGGGIDTGGGLVGAARIEADYWFNDTMALSGGIGMMQSLRGGGAQPVTLHLGIKTRFNTYH